MTVTPQDAWSIPPFAACLFATALLAQSARYKLLDPDAFESTLHAYRILPEQIVRPAAILLPFAELAVALLLVIPPLRPVAAPATAVLFGAFAAAILTNLARGRTDIDCGCGDPRTHRPITPGLAAANLGFAALMLATLPMPSDWPTPTGVATAAFVAASVWLLTTAYATLATLPLRRAR